MEEMLPLFEIRVGSKDSKALGIYRPSVDTSLVVLSNQPPKKKTFTWFCWFDLVLNTS